MTDINLSKSALERAHKRLVREYANESIVFLCDLLATLLDRADEDDPVTIHFES